MILDLWTFSSVLNDILDFIVYLIDNETFSLGLIVCTVLFIFVSYIAWRSTDIPQDVPSAPAPPFVITLQNSNTGGIGVRRQTLSDIRVITSDSFVDFPSRPGRGSRSLRNRNITTSASNTPSNQNSESTSGTTESRPLQRPTRSLLGFLPHPHIARAWLSSHSRPRLNLILPGLFVVTGPIGRIFHYHRLRFQSSNLPPRDNLTNHNQSASRLETHQPVQPIPLANEVNDSNLEVTSGSPGRDTIVSTNIPSSVPSIDEITLGNINPQSIAPNSSTDSERLARATGDVESINDNQNLHNIMASPAYNKTAKATTTEPDANVGVNSAENLQEHPLQDVKFTLKFLNDTQMEVTTHLDEKVLDFKRRHFAKELSENKIVRLIFNGRVLEDQDNRTFQQSGIFDHCVVHCLIVTPQQTTNQQQHTSSNSGTYVGRNSNNRGPEPGMFFVSFVGILLIVMWFVCINFGSNLFTQSAFVSLGVLTALFIAGVIAFYMPMPVQNLNNIPN